MGKIKQPENHNDVLKVTGSFATKLSAIDDVEKRIFILRTLLELEVGESLPKREHHDEQRIEGEQPLPIGQPGAHFTSKEAVAN